MKHGMDSAVIPGFLDDIKSLLFTDLTHISVFHVGFDALAKSHTGNIIGHFQATGLIDIRGHLPAHANLKLTDNTSGSEFHDQIIYRACRINSGIRYDNVFTTTILDFP
jgi:hypothetical protein